MLKVLLLVDKRMNEKSAQRFLEEYFTGDSRELTERFSALADIKSLTTSCELQQAIDAICTIGREEEMLRTSVSRLSQLLYRYRRISAYVSCVAMWHELLNRKGTLTSPRMEQLRLFFNERKEEPLFAECEKALEELAQELPIPHHVYVAMNVREDGYPTEIGVLKTDGVQDMKNFEETKDESLNSLLSAEDTSMISRSLGPEFVYNRNLYGSHFDEYIQRTLEHEWKNKIAKASRIAEKVKITATADMLSLVKDLSFYQVALLTAEAFETRGYRLCRPEPKDHASLTITGALYPDLILRNQGIKGNDLLLTKGNAVIITGPNHSGKTSYLKTIGQCYMLAQLGFYVPCESMVFEPVKNIFTLFSAGEDSSMTASRMGVEVKKLTEILKKSTSTDLVLLNEPMTSTNPVEAVSICADLTRHFLEKGITHLLVTHLYDIYFLLKAQLSSALLPKLESLITQSHYDDQEGHMVHSYHLIAHEPLGNSYARETAAAYGITLGDMIAEKSLLSQAEDFCDTYNVDSIYEGDDPHGLSDNH